MTNGLAKVDPADMNVARFFMYALLGPTWDGSVYTGGGERIRSIAAGGIRLVVESLRTDITRTVKGGGRGRLRIDYGKDPQPAIDYVWSFLDGATTAGQLFWGSEAGTGVSVVAVEACVGACSVVDGSVRTGWDRGVRAGDGAVARCGLCCDPRSSARRSWLLERSRRRV